jgi:MFS family permease
MSFLSSLRSLTPMARRLVLMRLVIYLGVQCAYFIGVVGTLTFALGGGVGDNVLGIAILNGCMIVGSLVGGPLLDRIGPRGYFGLVVAGLVVAAASFQVLSSSMAGVLAGAVLLGFAWGMGDLVAKAFPAYLTDDPTQLKNLNSVMYTVSNAAVVAGPLAGGALAARFSTRAVFLLLGVCALAALVPAAGFRPQRLPSGAASGQDASAGASTLRRGFSAVFSLPALTLLFWSCFFSFLGYGAFDPVESLYYRDVLKVGVEWMGWLSAASGVGGIVGALVVLRIPTRHVTVRTLLATLSAEGAFCLVYVGTGSVAVALVGQILIGVAFGMMMPLLTTLVQTHAPLDVLGSVNAVMGFGNNVAGLVPLVCAPALARTFGVQGTLVAASLLVLAMPLVIGLTQRRRIDSLVDQERTANLVVEE